MYSAHKPAKDKYRALILEQIPPDFQMRRLGTPIGLNIKYFVKGSEEQDGKWCTDVPDFSNIIKFIEDVMTTVVYRDDRQIAKYVEPFDKKYDSKNPRAEVTIYEL